MDPAQLTDHERVRIYQDQHKAERKFDLLKDPLLLAPSDFVKKPEGIVALSPVRVLCLLVYRLAEHDAARLCLPLSCVGKGD